MALKQLADKSLARGIKGQTGGECDDLGGGVGALLFQYLFCTLLSHNGMIVVTSEETFTPSLMALYKASHDVIIFASTGNGRSFLDVVSLLHIQLLDIPFSIGSQVLRGDLNFFVPSISPDLSLCLFELEWERRANTVEPVLPVRCPPSPPG